MTSTLVQVPTASQTQEVAGNLQKTYTREAAAVLQKHDSVEASAQVCGSLNSVQAAFGKQAESGSKQPAGPSRKDQSQFGVAKLLCVPIDRSNSQDLDSNSDSSKQSRLFSYDTCNDAYNLCHAVSNDSVGPLLKGNFGQVGVLESYAKIWSNIPHSNSNFELNSLRGAQVEMVKNQQVLHPLNYNDLSMLQLSSLPAAFSKLPKSMNTESNNQQTEEKDTRANKKSVTQQITTQVSLMDHLFKNESQKQGLETQIESIRQQFTFFNQPNSTQSLSQLASEVISVINQNQYVPPPTTALVNPSSDMSQAAKPFQPTNLYQNLMPTPSGGVQQQYKSPQLNYMSAKPQNQQYRPKALSMAPDNFCQTQPSKAQSKGDIVQPQPVKKMSDNLSGLCSEQKSFSTQCSPPLGHIQKPMEHVQKSRQLFSSQEKHPSDQNDDLLDFNLEQIIDNLLNDNNDVQIDQSRAEACKKQVNCCQPEQRLPYQRFYSIDTVNSLY